MTLFTSVFMINYFNMYTIKPEFIKSEITEALNIDISKKTRKREYAEARALYYVLCRKYTIYSLKKIGEEVNRDHASVIHGINNIFPLIDKSLYNILNLKFKKIITRYFELAN